MSGYGTFDPRVHCDREPLHPSPMSPGASSDSSEPKRELSAFELLPEEFWNVLIPLLEIDTLRACSHLSTCVQHKVFEKLGQFLEMQLYELNDVISAYIRPNKSVESFLTFHPGNHFESGKRYLGGFYQLVSPYAHSVLLNMSDTQFVVLISKFVTCLQRSLVYKHLRYPHCNRSAACTGIVSFVAGTGGSVVFGASIVALIRAVRGLEPLASSLTSFAGLGIVGGFCIFISCWLLDMLVTDAAKSQMKFNPRRSWAEFLSTFYSRDGYMEQLLKHRRDQFSRLRPYSPPLTSVANDPMMEEVELPFL